MNAAERRVFFKRAALVVWGMATLVLVFVVALLVYTMMEQGQDPLALATQIKPRPATERQASVARVRTKEVRLFFATAGGRLRIETRPIEFSDSTALNCHKALEALILGPSGDALAAILPANAQIRAMYLLETGDLIVDFGQFQVGQQKSAWSASSEALMAYGVTNTLTQATLQGETGVPVKTVRFLFEGSAPPESFPAHLDLGAPLAPDSNWLEAAVSQASSPVIRGSASQ